MFGRKKKAEHLKTSQNQSTTNSLSEAMSLTPERLLEILEAAPLSPAVKQALINELPNFIETVDDSARQIFDPNQIWLESLQFADYVGQLGDHLLDNHGDDCIAEIAHQLKAMSLSWKLMAENAMRVLDEAEGTLEFKNAQQ